MASQFHNRLVGVTILAASVVIFLPSIIDGKKTAYEDEIVATPIKPQLKAHTQQAAPEQDVTPVLDSPEQVISNKTEVENNQWEIQGVAETVASSPSKKVKTLESQSNAVNIPVKTAKVEVPEKAWTIQLGAFQNAQNINVLLKKLHKAGYQAHTVPREVIDGELTRVFVGPDVSKKKLEKQLPQLKRLTKLQGKLISFNAVNP